MTSWPENSVGEQKNKCCGGQLVGLGTLDLDLANTRSVIRKILVGQWSVEIEGWVDWYPYVNLDQLVSGQWTLSVNIALWVSQSVGPIYVDLCHYLPP